jgi:hypothetical protein
VALYHYYLDIIDVFEMMSTLQPVRKRGRPPTREKAPEHDRDVEDGVKSVEPVRCWRNQLIRHSECLTIFAYDTRAYEKKNRTVCFPDAPAGGIQDLDMESAALEEAIKLALQEPLVGRFQRQNDSLW